MQVEYELDQWEWQGTTRSIEIDPDDYRNMSADDIKRAVYAEIKLDAESNLHLVYNEDEVAANIGDTFQPTDKATHGRLQKKGSPRYQNIYARQPCKQ